MGLALHSPPSGLLPHCPFSWLQSGVSPRDPALVLRKSTAREVATEAPRQGLVRPEAGPPESASCSPSVSPTAWPADATSLTPFQLPPVLLTAVFGGAACSVIAAPQVEPLGWHRVPPAQVLRPLVHLPPPSWPSHTLGPWGLSCGKAFVISHQASVWPPPPPAAIFSLLLLLLSSPFQLFPSAEASSPQADHLLLPAILPS